MDHQRRRGSITRHEVFAPFIHGRLALPSGAPVLAGRPDRVGAAEAGRWKMSQTPHVRSLATAYVEAHAIDHPDHRKREDNEMSVWGSIFAAGYDHIMSGAEKATL